MTHIPCHWLFAASGLLVASRCQFVLPPMPPMGHLGKLSEPRRLAKFVESYFYVDDNCTKGESLIKTAVGCSLIYHKALVDMMGWDIPGMSIMTKCEGDLDKLGTGNRVKESIYLSEDCSGDSGGVYSYKRDECSDLADGATKKIISCDAEHDTVTVRSYADSSCSKLLITGIAWVWGHGHDDKDACTRDGKYFHKGECHPDGSFTSTTYTDSACTQKSFVGWDKYSMGTCVPMPVDPNEPPSEIGPLWVKAEGKNPCPGEPAASGTVHSDAFEPAASGTVHIAALGGIAWLVALCSMMLQ